MGHRHLRLLAAAAVVAGAGLSMHGAGAAFAQDTVSLSIAPGGSFGSFSPGLARDYTTSLAATATSTGAKSTLTVLDPSPVAPGHLVNGSYSLPQPLHAKAASATGTGSTAFAPISGPRARSRSWSWAAPIVERPVTITPQAVDRRDRRPARRRLRQDPRVHAVEREPMNGRAHRGRGLLIAALLAAACGGSLGDSLRAADGGRPGARVRARRAARPRAGRARPHRERAGLRRIRPAERHGEPGRRPARRRALRRRDVHGGGAGGVPAGRHRRARGPDDLAARRPARPGPARQRRRR